MFRFANYVMVCVKGNGNITGIICLRIFQTVRIVLCCARDMFLGAAIEMNNAIG